MSVNESARRIVIVSVVAYLPLGLLGVAWASWRDGFPPALTVSEPWLALPSPLVSHGVSAALGAGLAIATIALSRLWVRQFAWARDLHVAFRELLGGVGGGTVTLLALLSGVGEELFFRAGMQPAIGWMLTSLVFGLVHFAPERRLLPWTAWAIVMGFLLGAIYESTGSIVGPILAHVWINASNLRFIVEHDPRGPSTSTAPHIVSRRERR